MGKVQTMELYGLYKRPDWAGPICISDNDPNTIASKTVKAANPRRVQGIILPVLTGERTTTPAPHSGFPTGKALGTDKGHMMGLQLGGPNVPENIAPQTSLWQQSGAWRTLEKEALALAMSWMGLAKCYDPSQDMPMPKYAAYFLVSPLSNAPNGEPMSYEGYLTLVVPAKNGDYSRPSEADQRTSIFTMTVGGVSWPKGKYTGDKNDNNNNNNNSNSNSNSVGSSGSVAMSD